MKTYIGVKIVQAEPLSLGDYNLRRGWALPADENPLRAGFYLRYPDGYVSWSPAEIFNGAYRLISDEERSLVTAPVARAETFYDRLLAKSKALEEKREKLAGFFGTDAFLALDLYNQTLLRNQDSVMAEYAAILGQRIEVAQGKGAIASTREFEQVGETKIIGGDKSEEPIPFS